ncbi:hypothetical protein ACQ86N_17425 [Puia sp. P3]|uniref:hypothetical protein n=1 Tax=Puia sp. P3 TaxID=3423952 RepID=UPI003D6794E6
MSTGGYLVRKRQGWQHQRERVSAAWLKQGDNIIRFTLPASADYSYKVRNLAIEVGGPAEDESVVTSSPSYYGDKGYVGGFLTGAGRNRATVTIDGKTARVWKGAFEAVVQRPAGTTGSWQSSIEIQYPDGKKKIRRSSLTTNKPPTSPRNYQRPSLTPNVSYNKTSPQPSP